MDGRISNSSLDILLRELVEADFGTDSKARAFHTGMDLSGMSRDELLGELAFLRWLAGAIGFVALIEPRPSIREFDNAALTGRLNDIDNELRRWRVRWMA